MKFFNRTQKETMRDIWEREREEIKLRPDYVSYQDYDVIRESLKDEPIDISLLSPRNIELLVSCLMKRQGHIFIGGGWRETFGESYVEIGSWTPTINENKDPREFARKSRAIGAVVIQLEKMYQERIIQRIFDEAKLAILKELGA